MKEIKILCRKREGEFQRLREAESTITQWSHTFRIEGPEGDLLADNMMHVSEALTKGVEFLERH